MDQFTFHYVPVPAVWLKFRCRNKCGVMCMIWSILWFSLRESLSNDLLANTVWGGRELETIFLTRAFSLYWILEMRVFVVKGSEAVSSTTQTFTLKKVFSPIWTSQAFALSQLFSWYYTNYLYFLNVVYIFSIIIIINSRSNDSQQQINAASYSVRIWHHNSNPNNAYWSFFFAILYIHKLFIIFMLYHV